MIFIRFCYVLINCNELSHSGIRKVNESCGFSTIWALTGYVRGHLHLSEFLGWAPDGAFTLCRPKMAASHAQLSPGVQHILSGTQAVVRKDIRQVTRQSGSDHKCKCGSPSYAEHWLGWPDNKNSPTTRPHTFPFSDLVRAITVEWVSETKNHHWTNHLLNLGVD